LYERQHECGGALRIVSSYDETFVESDDEEAEEVKVCLKKAIA
jgi:hypothetical protein